MKILLDSWVWIEIFKGTAVGIRLAEQMRKTPGENVFTTSANLFEVCYRIKEDYGEEKAKQLQAFIENRSTVLSVDKTVALTAVEIRLKEGLRAIDAFTLAAARLQQAKVFTGDEHFKGLKDVVFFD